MLAGVRADFTLCGATPHLWPTHSSSTTRNFSKADLLVFWMREAWCLRMCVCVFLVKETAAHLPFEISPQLIYR